MLLDSLLAMRIALSLLIGLVILYVREPADFTGFPTLLLFITLFRLALNVASTRLILLDGYAGHIIEAFGNFVIRGNYVVGAVVFLILVVINFMVITKGAGRIAEVAARFTLDAMPGKQMAIDAELNAGIIDEATATKRRTKVQKEADFYGAMDGFIGRSRLESRAATALAAGSELARPHGKQGAEPVAKTGDEFKKLIEVDSFTIELGTGLLHLAEKKNGGDLLDRVTGVRKT